MLDIGMAELLIILIVALLVLGPRRLPEVARKLGRGLAAFRRTSEDLRRSILLDDEPPHHPPPYTGAFPKTSKDRSGQMPPAPYLEETPSGEPEDSGESHAPGDAAAQDGKKDDRDEG